MVRACLIGLLLALPLPAGADWIERVITQLSPMPGYVVKQRDGEAGVFYVDLGRDSGVQTGDLLAVLSAASELVHPVTGQRIPQSGEVRAVLGVTRVMAGTATVTLLQGEGVAVGDPVRRFAGLPARWLAQPASDDELYQRLRSGLPELEWQGVAPSADAPAGAAVLLFVPDADGLSVRFGDAWLVRTFAAEDAATAPVISPPLPVIPAPAAATVVPTLPGVASARSLARVPFEPLSELSAPARAADTVEYAGRHWLASASRETLQLAALERGQLRELASLEIPHRNRLLALRWWHPNADQPPLLALTTWDGEQVEGMLLRLEGESLEPLRLDLPYILGSFDLDNDGRREALLGQLFARERFYSRYLRRLELNGQQLQESSLPLTVPRDFSVLGGAIADLDGDGRSEVVLVRDRTLAIYGPDGNKLYAYTQRVGAGLSALAYDVSPGQELSPVERVYFEMPPLVVRRESRAGAELIVTAARFPQFSAPGIDDWASESWVSLIRVEGGRFQASALTEALEQPLLTLAAVGERVLLMASRPGSGLPMAGAGGQLLAIRVPTP